MPALSTELRNLLSNRIESARDVAEEGARAALMTLAVHHHEPYVSMTNQERILRSRLRAHGRQLGDKRNQKSGTQEILCLSRECAYQHWHRMLFARFLMENGLLREPDYGVPVSMAECEELAHDRREDPWALVGSFAQRMLPAIFREDDPALWVSLPPESRQKLEWILASLPAEVFTADDALGWTYQFWQTAEKKRVNDRVDSGEKIDGRMLPAVTQLFTEDYMVRFLLHNTLGAWHAGKVLAQNPKFAESARSEDELRAAISPEGYDLDYLRFVREPAGEEGKPGPWHPAAGAYEAWPRHARELKVLEILTTSLIQPYPVQRNWQQTGYKRILLATETAKAAFFMDIKKPPIFSTGGAMLRLESRYHF